jgi:transposase-like protein
MEGDKPKRQKSKRYPIGYFHIDIAELRTNEAKFYIFVAVDRTSKFTVAQLVDKSNRKTAWEFLDAVLEAVPYKIQTIPAPLSSFACKRLPGNEQQHPVL